MPSQDNPESTLPVQNTLKESIDNPMETNNTRNKNYLPLLIFVKGIYNFTNLCSELVELIGVDQFYCKSSTDRFKIMKTDTGAYRTLVHFLREQKAKFHTFQLKEDKLTRIIIRNLHPTTSTELIKTELEVRIFEVRQVTSVLHKINKYPLPLFFVDPEPTVKSNEIYKLTPLLYTKIKIEEPYKSKVIFQYINCQDYGYTKSYCGYRACCVRCGAYHSSSEYTISRDAPPKCVLCADVHPSNYKDCSFYRDLQRHKKTETKYFSF